MNRKIIAAAAQLAAPAAQAAPASEALVTSATASVRILKPESFSSDSLAKTAAAHPASVQLRTDAQGTPWIDFS